jgi:hypothetical protein
MQSWKSNGPRPHFGNQHHDRVSAGSRARYQRSHVAHVTCLVIQPCSSKSLVLNAPSRSSASCQIPRATSRLQAAHGTFRATLAITNSPFHGQTRSSSVICRLASDLNNLAGSMSLVFLFPITSYRFNIRFFPLDSDLYNILLKLLASREPMLNKKSIQFISFKLAGVPCKLDIENW